MQTHSQQIVARRARRDEIVAAYRRLGTLQAAGAEYGLTRERVRQIIARHEDETGERIPRTGNALRHAAMPVVTWICRRCGRTWSSAPSKVGVCKTDCPKKRGVPASFYEGLIAERRAGASWADLAARCGKPRHWLSHPQRFIWLHLKRLGRLSEVPEIWQSEGWRWLERWDAKRPARRKASA